MDRAVGLGSEDLVAHLLGEGREKEQDAELSGAHQTLYGRYVDRLPAPRDAGRLRRRLDHEGWPVVLATSASGPELSGPRRAISAEDAIAATASADAVERGTPAPEHGVGHAGGRVGRVRRPGPADLLARPADSPFGKR